MKARIEINFERILRLKVNEELLKRTPKLIQSTEKTIKKLCGYLKKYFKDKKIDVKINYEILEK
jgi:hypothetical protein